MAGDSYLHVQPLALIDALGGDHAGFAALAACYLDGAAAMRTRWQAACAHAHAPQLASLCHEWRTGALLFHAHALERQLAACETLARSGRLAPAAALADIEAELIMVEYELRHAVRAGPARRPHPAHPVPAPGPCILVADDAELGRALICRHLAQAGCKMAQAADGAAALLALCSAPHALVFMDLDMPILDGCAASRAWRRHEQLRGGPAIPIIGMSADGPATAQPWRSAGINVMLAKPLQAGVVAALLRQWLDWPPPA